MSQPTDLERRLSAHFATEAPPRAPDRLLELALAETEALRQRRRPREVLMSYPLFRLAAAAAVVVALAGVGAFALGRPAPPAGGLPVTPTGPAGAITPDPQGRMPTAALQVGAKVPAGRYVTSVFEPTLTFTAPEGWGLNVESPRYFTLGQGEQFVGILAPEVVVDPATNEEIPLPADLPTWLQAHPAFTFDPPRTTVIHGRSATVLEGTMDPAAATRDGRLYLFSKVSADVYLLTRNRVRFTIFPVGDATLVAVLEGAQPRWEEYVAEMEGIVASYRFEPAS